MRKIIAVVTAVAALSVLPAGSLHVSAAERGTECTLNGKAKFSPGLSSTLKATKYTFAGKLTDCLSTKAGLKSAKVTAAGAGEVSCATGSTSGKALITWNTGKTTAVKFNTYDAGALAELEGQVTSTTEKAFKKGDKIFGSLVFDADPTLCAGSGITSAVFQGKVGGGSPN
jgi:hypothetical protein